MPEFISRPNFGPASNLWEKAIQLVAQRSNPMAEGINAGLDTMGQGLQMGANVAMHKDSQANALKMQGNQFNQAKQELYRAHVADLAIKGQLMPIGNSMDIPVSQTMGIINGASPTPMMTPNAGPAVGGMTPNTLPTPDQYATPGPSSGSKLPDGTTITTHQLAAILGVDPAGENMAIKGPTSKMDDWMRQYTFKKSLGGGLGGGTDPAHADARSMLSAWIKDNPDASDDEISYAFASFLKIAKAAQGGAVPAKPAAKPAEEEPGTGLFRSIYNYATGTSSKPAAKKARAPIGSLFKK